MKILVYGTGSIAKRHISVLKKIYPKSKIFSISRSNRELGHTTSIDYKDCTGSYFDIILIASSTNNHDSDLHHALSLENDLIFIEKPISLSENNANKLLSRINRLGKRVIVGYDLRYHPIILQLKKDVSNYISGQDNIFLNVKVAQNLDYWRRDDAPRRSYSFNQTSSGGVYFELSHELDFLHFIFDKRTSVSNSFYSSNFFNTNLEDISRSEISFLHEKTNVNVLLDMDMISHLFERYIIVNMPKRTFRYDLLNGFITEYEGGQKVSDSKFDIDRDRRVYLMWKDVMLKKDHLPSYEECLKLLFKK